MKTVKRVFLSVLICATALAFTSCIPKCGCGNPPPRESWYVHTYYKTSRGASLLNSNTANCFKPADISVKAIVEVNDLRTEEYYGNDQNAVTVQENGDQEGNSLILRLPVKYGSKKPLMTLIRLRPNLTDTVTYSFNGRFMDLDREIPDQLYYNRKLIWDFTKSIGGEPLPNSITIIK
jgi:hypothetical protein